MIITWPQIILLLTIALIIIFRKPLHKIIDLFIERYKKKIPFYTCWFIVVLIIIISIIFDFKVFQSNKGFILLLLLLGFILLPFLKSLNVGNLFKIELQKIEESIDKLRDTVYNVLHLNIQSKQTTNIFNLNTRDGRVEQIQTDLKSQRFSEQAYSLFKQGRFLESIDYYQKAFESDNNNWGAAYSLGYLYLSLRELKVKDSEWGFDEVERLSRSIVYSGIAIMKDPNHYMQYMNLGIAQGHIGGNKMLELAIRNLEKAFNILSFDKNVVKNPQLMVAKGKCRSFMGQFAETLKLIGDAREYRKQAIDILKACPTPVPHDRDLWLKQAEGALEKLKSLNQQA